MIPRFVYVKKKNVQNNRNRCVAIQIILHSFRDKNINIRHNEMSPSKHEYALEREVWTF